MDAKTRRRVRERAAGRCEYCRVRQDDEPFYRFHIEHVIARQHGGSDDFANLALACHHCNFHKGPNLTAIDPDTTRIVPLFNPRLQIWEEHFRLDPRSVIGMTEVGRATVRLLNMNQPSRLLLRSPDVHG